MIIVVEVKDFKLNNPTKALIGLNWGPTSGTKVPEVGDLFRLVPLVRDVQTQIVH